MATYLRADQKIDAHFCRSPVINVLYSSCPDVFWCLTAVALAVVGNTMAAHCVPSVTSRALCFCGTQTCRNWAT